MSYCTVEQMGVVRWSKAAADTAAAGIAQVKAAAQAIDLVLGYNGLYEAVTWDIAPIRIFVGADGNFRVDLGFYVSDLTAVKRYSAGGQLLVTLPAETGVRSRFWAAPAALGLTASDLRETGHGWAGIASGALRVTGIRGHSSLRDLNAGDALKAGQSVLRADKVVLMESDGVALANDKLIEPLDLLRSIAITAGRRDLRYQRDMSPTWSASGKSLLSGYIEALAALRGGGL